MLKFAIKRKIAFRIISLSVIFLSVAGTLLAEEKYNPYPIVFVHGYNNMPDKVARYQLWEKTFEEFKKYFFDFNKGEFKYHNDKWYNYEVTFDYRAMSNGDINDIALNLANFVDSIVDKLPHDQEKKVVIVAHSMGGLVTRRFLNIYDKNYETYQNKVEKVVFVDTPHLGSPLASGVILVDRMIPKLEEKKQEYSKYVDPNRDLDISWQTLAYLDLYDKIGDTLWLYNEFVDFDEEIISVRDMLAGYKKNPYGPHPDPKYDDSSGRYNPYKPHYEGQKVAVGELVVPATVKASKTLIGEARVYVRPGISYVAAYTEPVPLESQYDENETFLYNNANILATPSNFRTIRGTGWNNWFKGRGGSALFKLFASYEGFPTGNSLEYLDGGDGIVTKLSQIALAANQVEPNSTIYSINAFHTEAPNAWQTILQAIDDKPVIEDVRILRSYTQPPPNSNPYPYDWYFSSEAYVVVKVKDYLLADVEFEINNKSTYYLTFENLKEFKDPQSGKYKPYIKGREKKEFLKERTYDGTDFEKITITDINGNGFHPTLQPGEFYLKIIGTDSYGGLNISLKIKNPAQQEAECLIFAVSRASAVGYKNCYEVDENLRRRDYPNPPTPWYDNYTGELATTWDAHRWKAYSIFLASPDFLYIPPWIPAGIDAARAISTKLYAYGSWQAAGHSSATYPVWAERRANLLMNYSNYTGFSLDLQDKKIASAKFVGYIDEEFKGGGANFKMSVYRDTSNTLPPTQAFSGDTLLFNIDTASNTDGAYFKASIDPTYINPNGNNVWETRSDIPVPTFENRYNYIPEYLQYDLSTSYLGPKEKVEFERSAYILDPTVIIFIK